MHVEILQYDALYFSASFSCFWHISARLECSRLYPPGSGFDISYTLTNCQVAAWGDALLLAFWLNNALLSTD